MKIKTSSLAIGAAIAGILSATAAQAATKTDGLTGPSSGDVTMVQSALTSTPTDGRASTSPYVSSNTSDWYGNSRFGAGYSAYSQTSASPGGDSFAYNSLSVTARALNDTKTPLQAYVYASTNLSSLTSNVYAYVYSMGNLVRNGSRGGAQFNGTTNLTSFNSDFWKTPNIGFDVFGVNVSVNARVYGGASQSIFGRVWNDGINATLSQGGHIKAEVTGGASVGWGLASGGVSVKDLSLTSLSFPLAATATWWGFSPAPGACVSMANVGETYGASLQWLSGRVVLWGKAFWGAASNEYEIANWPGIQKNFGLANFPVQTKQVGNTCFPGAGTAPVVNGIIVG
jgi:hypothetical protein